MPEAKPLTHNQLANVLPVELAALLVDESDRDSPLDPLQQHTAH